MAIEEPEIRLDVELGDDLAQAVGATIGVDVRYAVEHQHGRQGKTSAVCGKQLAFARSDQLLIRKRNGHWLTCPPAALTPPLSLNGGGPQRTTPPRIIGVERWQPATRPRRRKKTWPPN